MSVKVPSAADVERARSSVAETVPEIFDYVDRRLEAVAREPLSRKGRDELRCARATLTALKAALADATGTIGAAAAAESEKAGGQ